MTRSYEGTGDEIVRIDLGGLGELVVEDDGCNDPDVCVYVDDGGSKQTLGGRISTARRRGALTEAEVVDALRRLEAAAERARKRAPTTTGRPSFYGQGPLVCRTCSRTWPAKDRDGSGECPDCRV